jgi:Raf kinase inhibitor-like YbhB/YbcL family protein
MNMTIMSPAFLYGGMIPAIYTADGADRSPPLYVSSIPETARSLALICDDPDAPGGTWVHWVLFNIPPNTKELKEGLPTDARLPDGSLQGVNDFGSLGYGGPAPPSGTHRYVFSLYALDCILDLQPGCRKYDLVAAMQGHTLAETQCIGQYRCR